MTVYWCRLCGTELELHTGEVDEATYRWYECPTHPNDFQDAAPPTMKVEGV